ncbi:MAG: sensor histidine kinase [Lachnospiraceae bacterium]
MQRRKKFWHVVKELYPFIFAALLLLIVCLSSNQSLVSLPVLYTLTGEYSQNGGDWIPLDEDTKLSALDGDIHIRGAFKENIPRGTVIQFYLDHIEATISVNGENMFANEPIDNQTAAAMCGTVWGSMESPGITTEDVVEIKLHNPHKFGNREAYSEFLHTFYGGSNMDLWEMLENKTFLFRWSGVFVMLISLVLMGVALTFSVMHNEFGKKLKNFGLLALFAGAYILFDTVDISLWSHIIVFNTHVLCLSIIFVFLELGILIRDELSNRVKLAAEVVVIAEEIVITIIMLLCLCKVVLLYDVMFLWIIIQMLICLLLFICCMYEIRCRTAEKSGMLHSYMIFLAVIFIDCVNAFFDWWSHGILSKMTFGVLFLIYLGKAVKYISKNYQASVRAERLEDELKNSRIVLAMSQIRAHFIFNVLNAISGMCKYDPEKADETVVRFSHYLRTNIDILQEDAPVAFRVALQHLEDYVALEQVRFGDRVKFVEDIAVDDFVIPSLVLQPIVENSIKHGLRPKESGGTVSLSTWAEEENIFISIQDDGVGFDKKAVSDKSAVGLNNVRFRLKYFMKGKMEIESEPGQGTKVTISIPCKEV